jgi:hypothetical protein
MAEIEWSLRGPQYANCNCAWGCPCQFNALPTYGDCHALVAMRIDRGRFGETRLDGLCWAATYSWPGAIHEGQGSQQFIIDEGPDQDQRHALSEILHGRESDEGATIFQVFATTMSTVLEPLFLPIELAIDVEACEARVVVPGLIESTGSPIISPFSGEPHRVTVALKSGISFAEAEFGSGTTRATGTIPLEFENSYGQFNHVNMTRHGVVR